MVALVVHNTSAEESTIRLRALYALWYPRRLESLRRGDTRKAVAVLRADGPAVLTDAVVRQDGTDEHR